MFKRFSLLCFVCSLSFVAQAQLVDRVVAVVNDETVLQSDLNRLSQTLAKPGSADDMLLNGETQASLKNNPKGQLDYLINERLFDSEIKRQNLSVTVERVEQEIRDIAKRNGVSRNEMLAMVKKQGMSASEYQDFIKTRIERQSLVETEITSKIRVSDEDVMAYYARKYPGASTGAYEYTLAHIFFNPKKGGAQAAKERAQKVASKLKAGENFETLAEQNSEDTNFTSGGLLGTFKSGEFSSEMESAVKDLDVGQTSGVAMSRSGFHVLKVLGKKVISDPRFDQEKEKIRGLLFEQAFSRHLKNWLTQKRQDSFIRINN